MPLAQSQILGNTETALCAYRVNTGLCGHVGLEVCDLLGWAVSIEFAVALPDGAEVLLFMAFGKLCPTYGRILCLVYQCS